METFISNIIRIMSHYGHVFLLEGVAYTLLLSLIAVAEIDLWSDWTHLFKKCIPVLSHDNPAVRIIAMAVTAAVLPFVIIFLMALIIIIFFRH